MEDTIMASIPNDQIGGSKGINNCDVAVNSNKGKESVNGFMDGTEVGFLDGPDKIIKHGPGKEKVKHVGSGSKRS
ncbi:hypothetical protein L6452_42235 [Arctium lappa]|uniref:Uncharacterized protein n=1 Tax=Arctium lappa TaxID=4217 RepID=A0ACB8XLR6_ARCLA|nr:hypothetical protein L6452_42235 [Arctium lappa]